MHKSDLGDRHWAGQSKVNAYADAGVQFSMHVCMNEKVCIHAYMHEGASDIALWSDSRKHKKECRVMLCMGFKRLHFASKRRMAALEVTECHRQRKPQARTVTRMQTGLTL